MASHEGPDEPEEWTTIKSTFNVIELLMNEEEVALKLDTIPSTELSRSMTLEEWHDQWSTQARNPWQLPGTLWERGRTNETPRKPTSYDELSWVCITSNPRVTRQKPILDLWPTDMWADEIMAKVLTNVSQIWLRWVPTETHEELNAAIIWCRMIDDHAVMKAWTPVPKI